MKIHLLRYIISNLKWNNKHLLSNLKSKTKVVRQVHQCTTEEHGPVSICRTSQATAFWTWNLKRYWYIDRSIHVPLRNMDQCLNTTNHNIHIWNFSYSLIISTLQWNNTKNISQARAFQNFRCIHVPLRNTDQTLM